MAVLEGLPDKVREVPIRDFEQHFLPRLKFTNEDLGKIYKEVESLSIQQGTQRKWKALDRPSTQREPVLFADFAEIEQGIIKAATHSTGRQPIAEFTSNGNAIPKGPWPEKARPEGTGMPLSKKHCTQANHWVNVFQVQEFKKEENMKDQLDNINKAVYGMHHIMRSDASRRFTFGLTIDGRRARLWFASRAFIVASKTFDFHDNWQQFVRITLALGFAEEQELGWDPTMTLTDEGEPKSIRVGKETYKIVDIISNSRAHSLLGRATRVYRVQDTNENNLVVKDVWADISRDREDKIQRAIFQAIEDDDEWDTEFKMNLKRFFYTHDQFGDVLLKDLDNTQGREVADSTEKYLRGFNLYEIEPSLALRLQPPDLEPPDQAGRGQIPSPNCSQDVDKSAAAGASSLTLSKQPNDVTSKRISHRVRYRLAMKEVGQPLYDILDIKKELGILDELVDVIFALAKLGWVHRDLSVSNVFSCEGHLKLGDLEYAKNFSSPTALSEHDFRTVGTPMFWSIEVELENYRYISANTSPLSLPDVHFFANISAPSVSRRVPPFWHNPLHDYESFWWMLLYSFAMRILSEPDSEWNSDAQVVELNIAFPGRSQTTGRLQVFEVEDHLARVFQSFEIKLQPAHPFMNYIRDTLIKAFKLAEAPLPAGEIDRSVWAYDKILHTAIKLATKQLKAYDWPKVENLLRAKENKHSRTAS